MGVTPYTVQNDSVFVLKTTNGGVNWFKAYTGAGQYVGMNKIYFINQNTGFSCGVGLFNGSTGINKTTTGGSTWFSLNEPVTFLTYNDMSILNQNTIWLAASSNPTGGVFFTSNGGLNWIQQASFDPANPAHIYMYIARIGFIDAGNLRKITDGGATWTQIPGAGNFPDMYFKDSLNGWKCNADIKRTTDGGLTWIQQTLPFGRNIIGHNIWKISNFGNDSLWGV